MEFSMEIPNTEEIKSTIIEEIKPEPEQVEQIKSATNKNVESLMNIDMDSLEQRRAVVESIEGFGMETIQASSEKNALLQISVKQLSDTGTDGGVISDGLTQLQKEMKDLDPSAVDFAKKGIFGKILNPVKSYFDKYEKADEAINSIINSLEQGRTTLKNDNTTLEIEEVSLRDLTKRMAKEIEMGSLMDEDITYNLDIAKSKNEDADKIRFIQEEILFPLRQRIMDMQQMMVVNQQGIIAIEVIRRNNKELIRGVDRARNVTISALRIATIVASALYNQKIVLNKIQVLNETTNEMISATARMLKEQGAEIHKESMETSISIDTLKTAFEDTMSALDAISSYKQEALPRMKETISQFKELVDKGEKEISILERIR